MAIDTRPDDPRLRNLGRMLLKFLDACPGEIDVESAHNAE